MKSFNNYNKINENQISFEIHNNDKYKLSFMNAIRRICIGEVKINAINIESINIYNNTSCINHSMLKKRLELCPIYKKNIYDNLKLSLDITNTDFKMKSIYLSDFKILNKHSNKEEFDYNISDIFIYPKILFAKLKQDENIYIEAEFTENNLNNANSAFCPVCPITFHFKQDEAKVKNELSKLKSEFEKNDYKLRDADRLYQMNEKYEPTICVYSLESCGNISPNQIIKECLDIFEQKLLNQIKKIESYNSNELLEIKKADYNIESFDYRFKYEDTTLGNLLQEYIFENNKINFVGYDVPHPLDNILIIRLGLNKDTTIENTNKIMIDTINMIIDYIKDLQKEWDSIE